MENNNKLIFIVDDDQIYSSLAANRLSKLENTRTEIFNTGESMLEQVSLNPELIVLDYNLNSAKVDAMDGKSVMKTLIDQEKKIPIILLSGQKDIETAIELLKFNASDYISKGDQDLDKLEESVKKVLKMKEIQKEIHVNKNENSKLKKRMALSCSIFLLVILTIYFF